MYKGIRKKKGGEGENLKGKNYCMLCIPNLQGQTQFYIRVICKVRRLGEENNPVLT
jgi:hypothetical protein